MQTDFVISGGGSILLFTATNADALKHLQDNVSEESQWLGDSLAVEHRYASVLAGALQEHGFSVS